ncbi:leukemia inhibitory factor receptor-like [Cololabis saira]|uniref:leukemia inhibitory factor receptor-like n=1 Tax=Cololabis saira TaxID=129043 RepID=UPI002AD55C39|nr:leukemia inhibitory factor receptor-like [Cololabis saira]
MMMKISWLLLLPGLCRAWLAGTGPEPEPGVPRCRPQNLTLTGSDRNLLLTWEDPPACISLRDPLVYELTVLMEDKQVHQEEVAVATARPGAPHRWSWTSPVPLECVSHSVRLSRRYDGGAPWEETRTLPGRGGSRAAGVFPRDQMFRVGSEATFCCVPAPGETSRDMYVSGDYAAPLSTTRLGNRSYALTVRLDRTSPRCVDVKCRTDRREYGACTFISEPPQDRDLQCETRDLESVLCRWTPGWDSDRTVYSLLGSPCAPPVGGRCSQETDVGVGRRNWTLTAQNPLGTLVLRDVAELAQRVRMYAPVGVAAARVDARSASLAWRWAEPRYRSLDLTCQVSAEHGRGPSVVS